jgi:hypothetical protein
MTTKRALMRKTLVAVIILGATAVAVSEHHEGAMHPAKIAGGDMTGAIFKRDDMTRTEHENGNVTLDVTSLLSSDGKFASGMYQSDKVRSEIKEAYGVDEFMYRNQGRGCRDDSQGVDRCMGHERLQEDLGDLLGGRFRPVTPAPSQ